MRVAAIVEGDGEVAALPLLLRRLAEWRAPNTIADALPPIRVRRDRFLNREDEFRRYLILAGAKGGETTDQPAFSAHMDLQQAFERSRSFRQLCREREKHVQAARTCSSAR